MKVLKKKKLFETEQCPKIETWLVVRFTAGRTYLGDHVSGEGYVGVVGVEADVVGEVRELVLAHGQVVGVVDRDDDGLLETLAAAGLDVLGFLDDSGVDVVLREDLVDRRWDHTLGVLALEDGGDVSLDELSLVYVDAGPGGGLQEGRVLVSAEEDSRQESDFLAELADGVAVHGALGLNVTGLDHTTVVVDESGLAVVLGVGDDVIVVAEVVQFLIRKTLGYLVQEVDGVLLLLEQILVRCEKRVQKYSTINYTALNRVEEAYNIRMATGNCEVSFMAFDEEATELEGRRLGGILKRLSLCQVIEVFL